jgi:hypothetical protein
MPSVPKPPQGPTGIDQWQTQYINITFNICSIVTMPVECGLYLEHGTRYFPPVVQFMCMGFVLVFAAFSGIASAMASMLPSFRNGAAFGFISMMTFVKLFYGALVYHGWRKWKLMWHMEREENSYYSGKPLPIFGWIPKTTFWRRTIVYEPALVLILSRLLPSLYVVDNAVGTFLFFSGICLAMKQYLRWYMEWTVLRDLADGQSAGAKLASIANSKAANDEARATSPDSPTATIAHVATTNAE